MCKDVREHLDLEPGQKLQAIGYKGRIELIPVEPIEASRGLLRGIDTSVPRDSESAVEFRKRGGAGSAD